MKGLWHESSEEPVVSENGTKIVMVLKNESRFLYLWTLTGNETITWERRVDLDGIVLWCYYDDLFHAILINEEDEQAINEALTITRKAGEFWGTLSKALGERLNEENNLS